jgi:predicted lysophospholipase L1 biosynthesis ABC-type transport system permease subunit
VAIKDTATQRERFRPTLPTKLAPAAEIRDMPDPPAAIWRIVGPGIVGAGVGLASGEFILWPEAEGDRLDELVGSWFGPLFWGIGAFSLFAASMGIVDYTSRIAADVLKVNYLRDSRVSESKLYFRLVWGLVAIGTMILLVGVDQPLLLLVISACVGGTMMFMYSILLLIMNRRSLPPPLQVRSYRVGALLFATGFFGVLSVITIIEQVGLLLE